jgi:hypothetical protein
MPLGKVDEWHNEMQAYNWSLQRPKLRFARPLSFNVGSHERNFHSVRHYRCRGSRLWVRAVSASQSTDTESARALCPLHGGSKVAASFNHTELPHITTAVLLLWYLCRRPKTARTYFHHLIHSSCCYIARSRVLLLARMSPNPSFERDAAKARRPSTLLQGLPQIYN